MPAKKRKADGTVTINVNESAPKKATTKKKNTYWRKSRSFPFTKAGARYLRSVAGGPFGVQLRKSSDKGKEYYGATWKQANEEQRAHRTNDGYYGRGGYFSNMWANRSKYFDAAHAASKALGYGAISGPIRGALKATGIGSYVTNTLVDEGKFAAGEVPTFTPISDTGELMVSHREYLTNIYGPPDNQFHLREFSINPGLESTFKWLSQIASNYEEYEIKQLIFTYKSTVSQFQTTTGTVGTIVTATQYNSKDPKYRSKEEMVQTNGGISCKSTDTLLSGIECDPTKVSGGYGGRYIRTTELTRSHDIAEYDLGRFNLALVDFPSSLHNQSIGELWVTYTVVLRRPRVYSSLGKTISKDQFLLTDTFTAGIMRSDDDNDAQLHLWDKSGAAEYKMPQNNLGVTLTSAFRSNFNLGFMTYGNFSLSTPYSGGIFNEALIIEFPPGLSGSYEITIRMVSKMGYTSKARAQAGYMAIGSEGNVQPINDILQDHTAGSIVLGVTNSWVEPVASPKRSICWDGGIGIIEGVADSASSSRYQPVVHCRLHVRVEQSTAGAANRVLFTTYLIKNFITGETASPDGQAGSAPESGGIAHAEVVVKEYNAMYKDNNGLPSWVHSQSGQPLTQPHN